MHMQLLPLLLLHGLCALVVAQGDMHPSVGMPAGCRLNVTNDCAPTYAASRQRLQALGVPGRHKVGTQHMA